MMEQIALGLLMTAITVAFSAVVIVTAGEVLSRNRARFVDQNTFSRHVVALALISTWLVIGMLLNVILWAGLLQILGVFHDVETSLYFSMISFTTVGYGDVVPPSQWRLLSGFLSVGGFLIFGLNTAFLFEVLRRMRGRG